MGNTVLPSGGLPATPETTVVEFGTPFPPPSEPSNRNGDTGQKNPDLPAHSGGSTATPETTVVEFGTPFPSRSVPSNSNGGTGQKNSSMSADGEYQSVAIVTAPVRKANDYWKIEEGTVVQAELVKKMDGTYFLKAGGKYYEMNTHRDSSQEIGSDAAAVRLAQNYLRYGYIAAKDAIVELSEPAGAAAQGNKLTISAVDKKAGTVKTAQLEQIGSNTYRFNDHEFRAASDAKAVEDAIARLENRSGER